MVVNSKSDVAASTIMKCFQIEAQILYSKIKSFVQRTSKAKLVNSTEINEIRRRRENANPIGTSGKQVIK